MAMSVAEREAKLKKQAVKKAKLVNRAKRLKAEGRANQLADVKHKKKELNKRIRNTRTYKTKTDAVEGVKNPTLDPFMNSEDMLRADEARASRDETLHNLDYALEELRSSNEYERTQIADRVREDKASTNASSAARGMFASSARDASLYDVDATAAVQRNILDRQLDVATLDAQRQKTLASQAFDAFQNTMAKKMVENAQAASPDQGLWATAPQAASTQKHKLDLPGVNVKPKGGQGPGGGGTPKGGGAAKNPGTKGGQGKPPPGWKPGKTTPHQGQNNPNSPSGPRPNMNRPPKKNVFGN